MGGRAPTPSSVPAEPECRAPGRRPRPQDRRRALHPPTPARRRAGGHRQSPHPRRARGPASACEATPDLETLALRTHAARRGTRLRQARRHALLRTRTRARMASHRSSVPEVGGSRWLEDRSSGGRAATTRSSTTSPASRNGRRSARAGARPSALSRQGSARSIPAPGESPARRRWPSTRLAGSSGAIQHGRQADVAALHRRRSRDTS